MYVEIIQHVRKLMGHMYASVIPDFSLQMDTVKHAVMEHMDINVHMIALAIERTLLIVMTSLGSVNVKTLGMEPRVQFM